jgi:hypothetical protein
VSVDFDKTYSRDSGVSGDADKATAKFKFNVDAFGADAFVDVDGSDHSFSVSGDTSAEIASLSSLADKLSESFKVKENNNEDFTLTIVITADENGFFDVSLDEIAYAFSNIDGDITYDFNLDDFETDPVYLSVTP